MKNGERGLKMWIKPTKKPKNALPPALPCQKNMKDVNVQMPDRKVCGRRNDFPTGIT